MAADNERKVIMVTRKTRLEDLIAKYLTAAQARFYVEHLGADFSDYQREHDIYWQQRHHAGQALGDRHARRSGLAATCRALRRSGAPRGSR